MRPTNPWGTDPSDFWPFFGVTRPQEGEKRVGDAILSRFPRSLSKMDGIFVRKWARIFRVYPLIPDPWPHAPPANTPRNSTMLTGFVTKFWSMGQQRRHLISSEDPMC